MTRKRIIKLIAGFTTLSLVLSSCGSAAKSDNTDADTAEAIQEEQPVEDPEAESEKELEAIYEDYFGDEESTLSAAIAKSGEIMTAKTDEEAQVVFRELERINGDKLKLVTDNYGYITFMKGSIFEKPCQSIDDFQRAIDILLPALTTDNNMKL